MVRDAQDLAGQTGCSRFEGKMYSRASDMPSSDGTGREDNGL